MILFCFLRHAVSRMFLLGVLWILWTDIQAHFFTFSKLERLTISAVNRLVYHGLRLLMVSLRVSSCSADQLHEDGNAINCCAQAAVPNQKCNTSGVTVRYCNIRNNVLILQSVLSTVTHKKLEKNSNVHSNSWRNLEKHVEKQY